MDSQARQHERQAASGDAEALARVWRDWIRAVPDEVPCIHPRPSPNVTNYHCFKCKGTGTVPRVETWEVDDPCQHSTGICGSDTRGHGALDNNGYWQRPCQDGCRGKTTATWPAFGMRQQARIAAYAGCPGARLLFEGNSEWLPFGLLPRIFDLVTPTPKHFDLLPLDRWITGLANVCAREVPCDQCAETKRRGYQPSGCIGCLGKLTKSVPDQRVMVRAAIAAAEVVVKKRCKNLCRGGDDHNCNGHRRAIAAARAWVKCPCAEHLGAWHFASTGPGTVNWVPSPAFPVGPALQAAVQETSEAAVREAICAALIKWTLKEMM